MISCIFLQNVSGLWLCEFHEKYLFTSLSVSNFWAFRFLLLRYWGRVTNMWNANCSKTCVTHVKEPAVKGHLSY